VMKNCSIDELRGYEKRLKMEYGFI